ncbi:MAG: helix-turn-helix domain-containing protein [Treponema sp.]|nr:helix-turn-helix domain-containing protein [Treponema sp.]
MLGRPAGRKPALQKLSEHDAEIRSLLAENGSKTAIARKFGVSRQTVYSFLQTHC